MISLNESFKGHAVSAALAGAARCKMISSAAAGK
jgi:hypothetical protein